MPAAQKAGEHIPVEGRFVVGCWKTKTDDGGDILHISFGDGSGLLIRADYQDCGFTVTQLKPGIG